MIPRRETRAANRAQGDHIITIIQNGALPAILVAEDLGVVPEYVRPHLPRAASRASRFRNGKLQPDGKFIAGIGIQPPFRGHLRDA